MNSGVAPESLDRYLREGVESAACCYDATTRAVMVFNETTKVLNDPRSSERLVWIGKAPVR
jgi:hypothetical protein